MSREQSQSALRFGAGVVGLFVAVGIGVGLVQNFTLAFLIEQLVDPGDDPMGNTLIGIVLVVDIITPFVVAPLVAVGGGAMLGRAIPDREQAAAVVGGLSSAVGFFLMTGFALFLTFAVLSQYSSGGGGGGGGPFGPSDLGPLIFKSAIPMAVVGGLGAYISARIH